MQHVSDRCGNFILCMHDHYAIDMVNVLLLDAIHTILLWLPRPACPKLRFNDLRALTAIVGGRQESVGIPSTAVW
eukprot:360672-Chlamydomonas_euryale.AAC.16